MTKKAVTSAEFKMEIGKGHPSSTSYFAKSFLNDFGRLQESIRTNTFSDNNELYYPNLPIFFDEYNGDHSVPNADYKYKINGSDIQQSRGLISKFTNPGASNHVCRVCAKTFRASSLLDIHMRVHVGAKPFVCPMCGHRATQKGNLKLHMKKHHGADLPPHIDLVPDSGIWGHPQENALCSSTAQINEEIDNADTSGKRKQVAQAVSSLLNEEIVELIKKCQNNVGQGMTGRITESLEDFIRIAKRKADDGSDNSAENVMNDIETTSSNQQKKRQLNSLRFKPYSSESGSSTKKYNNMRKEKSNMLKCLLCGKLINILAIPQLTLPICELCTILHRDVSRKPIPSKLDSKKIKHEVGKGDTVTINGIQSEECNGDKLSVQRNVCGNCDAMFISEADLENHLQRYHRPRSQPAPSTIKDSFLRYIGLVPKYSSEISIEEALKREECLNPIINCMLSQKWNDDFNTEVSQYTAKIQLPVTDKRTNYETSRKRFPGSRNKVELGTQKRASPGVLSMLRQAVLNSVEHRMVSGATHEKKMLNRENDNMFGREEYVSDVSRARLQTPFRNLAMLSLAEIGKTALDDSETEDEISNEFSDSAVDDEKYLNTSACKVTGGLLMDFQEQENGGYRCQFCPKRFKYRSVLEIHIRSHTGERPYKCPYCEYAGTQHNCLKLHVQRHHPKEYARNHSDVGSKSNSLSVSPSQLSGAEPIPNRMSCFSPVECPVCGRVSPSPGYLKIHMRSHKKSLDHVCHVCGRGFKEYWYLTTHLKTHERELSTMKYNIQQNKPPTAFELLAKSTLAKATENIKLQNKLLVNDAFSAMSNHNLLALHEPVREKHSNKRDFCFDDVFNNNAKKLSMVGGASNSNSGSTASTNKSEGYRDLPGNSKGRDAVIERNGVDETKNGTENKSTQKSFTHSSRRKAFCPSRIASDPYPSVMSTNYHSNLGSSKNTEQFSERRRSRSRKLQHQSSYLLPPSSKLSKSFEVENNVNACQVGPAKDIDEDMPLDLSCSTGKWRHEQDRNDNVEEKPLNLSK